MLSRTQSRREPPAEYYQIAQYTCTYDAVKRSVDCEPFVRTFMKVGVSFTEVTPTVNAGGRLPRGGLRVPTEAKAAHSVAVKGEHPPLSS
ncbi:hypothetical protein JCM10450v2_006734 [Rhodotorula kratochvilovae]